METIRQYIETLFVNLPNTSEVHDAKNHLLEMAEDKYISLKEEGLSDNEAVAKVIAEFGNLDELKEELGITEQVRWQNENRANVRMITEDEARNIISDYSKAALIRGLGCLCFISCVVPPILLGGNYSAAFMFVLIALGVVCMVLQSSTVENWKFIKVTHCGIDLAAATFIKEDRKQNFSTDSLIRVLGVISICMCFVPAIIFDGDIAAASLFLMIGFGVLLTGYAESRKKVYERLLNLNPMDTVGGSYVKGSQRIVYDNPNLAAVMSIFWPLTTCVYLAISFLTFMWWITWIVFPIAGLINNYIEGKYGERE